MKKLLLFVFAIFLFAACKKDNDPTPQDPATTIAGDYEVTRIAADAEEDSLSFDLELPQTDAGVTLSSVMEVTKQTNSPNTVSFEILLKETNQDDVSFIETDDVEVRQVGNGYDLYIGTTKIGTADGRNFNLDAETSDGRLIVEARKR